jgi:hypothetical protein
MRRISTFFSNFPVLVGIVASVEFGGVEVSDTGAEGANGCEGAAVAGAAAIGGVGAVAAGGGTDVMVDVCVIADGEEAGDGSATGTATGTMVGTALLGVIITVVGGDDA